MQQENRLNILSLLSLVAVIPTVFHGGMLTPFLFSAPRLSIDAQILRVLMSTVIVLCCLAAIAMGVIGLFQRDRVRLRWMAVAGIAVAVTHLLSQMFGYLAGVIAPFVM